MYSYSAIKNSDSLSTIAPLCSNYKELKKRVKSRKEKSEQFCKLISACFVLFELNCKIYQMPLSVDSSYFVLVIDQLQLQTLPDISELQQKRRHINLIDACNSPIS